MIKIILFDVDNTLMDFHECSRLATIKSFNEFNLTFDDHIFEVFKEINDLLWGKIETGELTREQLFKIRWQMIFDKVGIDCCGAQFEQTFLKNLAQQHAKIDGADEILQYLKQKYILCVASNAPYNLQMNRLNLSGLIKYFDHLFISEKIGHQKPTKAFFDFCFEKLGNPPKEQVIIIGDSPVADISGGTQYGITTCWFDTFNTCKKVDADYTIKNLLELKNIL